MITTAELHRIAEKEGLRFDQAEKDYVILWVLSGLVHSGLTRHGWVFKGGTCLRQRGLLTISALSPRKLSCYFPGLS